MRVLLLGGTGEARELAAALVAEPGMTVVSSLAGRVVAPSLPAGEVRIGGFRGADGLGRWLREHRVDAVVDATHPFAGDISASAAAACATSGVPLLVLVRPGWNPRDGDDWRVVTSLDAAAALLPSLGERVFLTVGRQGLGAFAASDRWFLVRTIDPPEAPLPARRHVLLARGPFTVAGERELLRRHRIDVLVTKDSGGTMTAAKLHAARAERLPVVVVARSSSSAAATRATTVDEALRWLRRALEELAHRGQLEEHRRLDRGG